MEDDLSRSRHFSETSNSSLSDGLDEWGCPYGILKARPASKAQRKEDRRQRREKNNNLTQAIDPTDDEFNPFEGESSDDSDHVFEAFGKGKEKAEKKLREEVTSDSDSEDENRDGYYKTNHYDIWKHDKSPAQASTTGAEEPEKSVVKKIEKREKTSVDANSNLSEKLIIVKSEKPSVEQILSDSTDAERDTLDQEEVTVDDRSEKDETVFQRNVQFEPKSDEFNRTKRVITRNNGFVSLQPTSTYHLDSPVFSSQENSGWCYQQGNDWTKKQPFEYHQAQARSYRPYFSSYKPAGPTNFKMNSNPMDCLDDDSDSPPNTPVLRKITMNKRIESLTVAADTFTKNGDGSVSKTKPDICADEPSPNEEDSGSSENKAVDRTRSLKEVLTDESSRKKLSNTSPERIISAASHETPEISKGEVPSGPSVEVSDVLQKSVSSDESSSEENETKSQLEDILMIARQKQEKCRQQKAISDDFEPADPSDDESVFSVESYEDPNDGEWVEPPSYSSNESKQLRQKMEDIEDPFSSSQFSAEEEKMIVSTLFALQRSATASQIVYMMKQLSGKDLGTTEEVDQKLSESRTIVKNNGTNAKGETIWTSVTQKDTAHIERLLDQEKSRKKAKFSKNKKVWGECFNDFSLQTLHEVKTETNPEKRKFTSVKNSESTHDTKNGGPPNYPLWLGPHVCDRIEASVSSPLVKVEKAETLAELCIKPKLSRKENAVRKKAEKKEYEANFDAQLRDAKKALRRKIRSERSSDSEEEEDMKTSERIGKRATETTTNTSTVAISRSFEMMTRNVVSSKTTRKTPEGSSDEDDCRKPERSPINENSERYSKSTWNLSRHEAGSRTKLFDIKRHLQKNPPAKTISNCWDDVSRKPQLQNSWTDSRANQEKRPFSTSRFNAENEIKKPSRGVRDLDSIRNTALDSDEEWDLVTTGQSSGPLMSEEKTKKPWEIGDDLKNLYRNVISGKSIPQASSDVNKENVSRPQPNFSSASAERIDETYAKALHGDDQASRLVTTLLSETNGRENLKQLCYRFNKRMRLLKDPTFAPLTLSNFWKYLYSLPQVTTEKCDIILVDPTKNPKYGSQEKRVCQNQCAEKIEVLRKEFAVMATEFHLVAEACGFELEPLRNDLTSNGLPI